MFSLIVYYPVLFVVCCIGLWYINLMRKPAGFPPGYLYILPFIESPFRWRLFIYIPLSSVFQLGPSGVLSFLDLYRQKEPYISKAIQKLSVEYGPVIGLILLHRKFVCVSSRQAAVDALNNKRLLGRPKSFDFSLRTKGLIRGKLKILSNYYLLRCNTKLLSYLFITRCRDD